MNSCLILIDIQNDYFPGGSMELAGMDDQQGAYRLAASGAIGAGALDYTNVGAFAAEYMMQRYPEMLLGRYKLTEVPDGAYPLLEAIGRRLGCLMAGGEVDIHRSAEAFLRELRAGKLGRISFEEPADMNQETPVAETAVQ